MRIVRLFMPVFFALLPTMAGATVIDFTSESVGFKPNGYTVAGVSFSDTIGAGLRVDDYAAQSDGNALGVLNDDPSGLVMIFGGVFDFLSLDFGNDDACCSFASDVAWLQIFLANTAVGSTAVTLNRNDLMDQTISLAGIAFDEARFFYATSALAPIFLIEVVDNITFDTVPSPATLALIGIGLAGLGWSRRKKA